MERRALGKGLSALIPEKTPSDKKNEIVFVQTESVKPNPFQPREHFDEEELQDLMQSIKEKGVIQPIIVRRIGDNYELIAGERRLRASKMLGLPEIPVIVKEVQDKDSLEISLIENIQRQELNPVEEARAFEYLIKKFQVTQEKISEALGVSRASVANLLRILKLPQEIQEEIKKGRISFAHAKALLEVENENYQRKLTQEIIAKGLSVRELENIIKMRRSPRSSYRKIEQPAREPIVAVLEEELQQFLATKVRIDKRKKRGHITIEFYSQEDLQRIAKIIKGVK